MRISDWSSDVCSSDLRAARMRGAVPAPSCPIAGQGGISSDELSRSSGLRHAAQAASPERAVATRRGDRKSVVEGKRVSVRVDLGGRRIITKKHKTKQHHIQPKTKVLTN